MKRLVPVVALALLLLPAPGDATTVVALDQEELTRRAALIVWGDCVDVRTEWNDARTQIFTRVLVTPRDTLKGEASSTLELKLPGGERDGKAYVVHGMPRFRQGQEVVLYATAPHPRSGVRVPVGLGQGLYVIHRDGAGRARARRDTRDLTLFEPGRPSRHGRVEELPLDTLLERIRERVRGQHGAGGAPR